MHDAGFERLEELFHSALALPVEERAAFLREHCATDLALRREVEEMLRADAGLLDVPVLERIGGEDLHGKMAGRWRLGRRIGEGGLGVVYEAFEGGKRGAVKFLRPGLDAGSFRRRFLKEQRILGALNHPHVAHLLDGGVDDNGRAYLVMEFVDGQRLDNYLTETRPGGTARLTLLTQVCRAVQYLHTALVAHGDLKPSNIFVSNGGQVKLLDFGAARLLHSEETTLTRAFLTPHYASPEQKQGEGPSVSSDVYALGVILGEAFPGGDADLMAIRDHCCRTEPGERYRSVLELEQDLQRYAEGKPVKARRQDRIYRAAKYLRRHVGGVGITAAVLAAAATGGFFAWREMRADQERLGKMRSVVRTVLDNSSSQVVSRSEDRRAMRDMTETAIKELEASGKAGMELELAAGWRRVGAARLEEGDTGKGVEALRRSYELAEGVWTAKRDLQAYESKALTLPLWALAVQARRDEGQSLDIAKRAVEMHGEYKKLFGKPLPPQNAYYRFALQAGPAWARRGEVDLGRTLLEDSLGAARRARSSEYTAKALIELAALETGPRKAAYCAEAGQAAPTATRLNDVCGGVVPRPIQGNAEIAALRVEIQTATAEMRRDPDRFQRLRGVAVKHSQLARLLHKAGRDPEARAELEAARRYLTALLKKNPDNEPVQAQANRVDRALTELSK